MFKLTTVKATITILALGAFGNISVKAADKISVTARGFSFSQIHPEREKFGHLLWSGGLVLKSNYKKFGGFSGVETSTDGKKVLMISDRGYWLKADFAFKNGKINGLKHAKMAPILNQYGKKFVSWQADSEGLTKRNQSLDDVIISVENSQAIYNFKFENPTLNANAKEWGFIKDAGKISQNRGLEGITTLPRNHKYRGWLLTTAERSLSANGHHSAWLVHGKQSLPLYITRYDGFDITDITHLPNGDLIILERAVSLLEGPRMQVRQICGTNVKPQALIRGKILLNANWLYGTDNMEGIAAHRASNGQTILTMISDNNFHFLQRNLLMQFALANEKSICN